MIDGDTGRSCYIAVNFLQNLKKRHPLAHPVGRVMGCLLCAQTLVYILPQTPQRFMHNEVILDMVMMTPDCIMFTGRGI